MMFVGYIVGIVLAAAAIICGCVGAILAKKNQKKSKWPMWTILAGMVALVSAAVNYNAFAATADLGESEFPFTSNRADDGIYAAYEPFGLVIHGTTGKLYYDGKLVRFFDDRYPGEDFRAIAVGYYEKAGVIDVRSIRDNSGSKSELVGLEALSSEEFNRRVITDLPESKESPL
jgi:hypothetical protein